MSEKFDYTDLFAANIPAQPRLPIPKVKYDFGTAHPDPDSLPLEGLWQGLRKGLNREGRNLALYPHIQGHPGLRELIAKKLRRDRQISVTSDDVVIGNGSSQLITMVFSLILNPGDIVLTEDFFYLGTLNTLRRFKSTLISMPTDEEGIITDELEKTLKALHSQGKKPKLIYLIPAYQNPLGMNLSSERRDKVVELSKQYGVPTLEDECYVDLRFEGETLPSLSSIDSSGRTIYVGSFSKIIAPGVRLGYAVLSKEILGRLLAIRLDGGPNELSSLAVYEYMQQHMYDHINDINGILKIKRDAMLSALGENFPPTCKWSKPQGSLYIWLELPLEADVSTIQHKSMDVGVRYIPGNLFSPTGKGKNCMRLCYGYNTPEEIKEGIAILARVFEEARML